MKNTTIINCVIYAVILSIISIYVLERVFSYLTSDIILSLLRYIRSHMDFSHQTAKQTYLVISRIAISTDSMLVAFLIGISLASLATKHGFKLYCWSLYLLIYSIPLILSLAKAIADNNTPNILGILIVIVFMWAFLFVGLSLNRLLISVSMRVTGRNKV
jgi:hypothetical protein